MKLGLVYVPVHQGWPISSSRRVVLVQSMLQRKSCTLSLSEYQLIVHGFEDWEWTVCSFSHPQFASLAVATLHTASNKTWGVRSRE